MSFEFSTNKFENALHPHPHFSNFPIIKTGVATCKQYFLDHRKSIKTTSSIVHIHRPSS